MKKQKLILISALCVLCLLIIPITTRAAYAWDIVAYDDGDPDLYLTPAVNDTVAVRFSAPTHIFKISGMILYLNSSNLENIKVSILNSTMSTIMAPYIPSFTFGLPPYHIDFGSLGPTMTSNNVTDFYIVVQWITTGAPNVGVDTSTGAGHSYRNISGSWQAYTGGDIMIRAQVEDINPPEFDHIPMQYAIIGEPISLAMEVLDEFGVDSVTVYYSENGTPGTYGAASLSREGGTENNGIWYGTIPEINVTAAGLYYYLWATDKGGNSRYYGNATTPFVIQVVGQIFEIPLYVSIILIVTLCAAAIVLYLYLPKYEGAEPG
jgi:hypothetical protein